MTAGTNYNKRYAGLFCRAYLQAVYRVFECKLSAALLAKHLGLELRIINKLKDVQEAAGKTLQEMLDIIEKCLHPAPYTKQEVATLLGVDVRLYVIRFYIYLLTGSHN